MQKQENPTPLVIMGKSNFRSKETGKLYELPIDFAIQALLEEIKDDNPLKLTKILDAIRDDMASHLVDKIDIDTFKQYHKVLKGMSKFMREFFVEIDEINRKN